MHVEQAVFTSARTSRNLGYHLVARSNGIRENLAQKLTAWCPTHASLLEENLDASSVSYFPLDTEWVALARSIYGGPEYSNRGDLQIITFILVLGRDQLAGYDFNPLALARTARTLGYLRLAPSLPEALPALELPESTLIGKAVPHCPTPAEANALDKAVGRIQQRKQVALVGWKDPIALAENCIFRAVGRHRLEISFTTGLKPSAHRPFCLYALGKVDEVTRQRLLSLGVDCIAA